MTIIAADVNVEALVIFAIVLSITLVVTYWASKRMTGAEAFWAAGCSICGFQNGLAIGDRLDPARVHRLLAGHDAVNRARQRAPVRRTARALGGRTGAEKAGGH